MKRSICFLSPSLRRTAAVLLFLTVCSSPIPCLTAVAGAAQVTLVWDAPDAAVPDGYKVYYGTASASYTQHVDAGNDTDCTIDGLEEDRTYYFAATAYYPDGSESGFSNEASKHIPVSDTDADGISDIDEINVTATDPNKADTDGDGIIDGDEVNTYGTNPNRMDTDSDGLMDSDEITTYSTEADNPDTDGDGCPDGDEIRLYGTDPRNGDTDDDGILDGDEVNTCASDPNIADTDGDGLMDGEELAYWGDDWQADIDADGIVNLLDADADGDGTPDGAEIDNGSDPSAPDDASPLPPMEIGEIEVDHHWTRVDLRQSFIHPVVTARLISLNDSDPAVLRIRNVDETGFEIRVQEWDYLDDLHAMETVGYMVMEEGVYTLDDGALVAAGHIETDRMTSYEKAVFRQPFPEAPVVVATITTFNGSDTVTPRLRRITPQGFECRMQEQEKNAQTHVTETIAYIAWEPSMGDIDGIQFDVYRTGDVVTHAFHDIRMDQDFLMPPMPLADMQTTDGGDTAGVRVRNRSAGGFEAAVAEEASRDSETSHTSEVVGYMVFSEVDEELDADQDGLSNGDEINLYGTDPANGDTDGDGIDDGKEASFWGGGWHTDPDGDGSINLLDPDADDDGYPDGVEIRMGYDPADPDAAPLLPPLAMGELQVDHNWIRVELNDDFIHPVVTARLLSLNDDAPAVVRIRNVDETGFEIRVQEWEYQDGVHAPETVGYMVMEQGAYTLGDGTLVEAGRVETPPYSTYGNISFSHLFREAPVLMASISTCREADAVTTRLKSIDARGTEYRLQEQEQNAQEHAPESLSYIAWEPSAGNVNGLQFEVNRTGDVVTQKFHPVQWDQVFAAPPLVLAGMQSLDGGDTAMVRIHSRNTLGVEVKIDEEASRDSETSHTTETVGYMSFTLSTP